MDKRRVTWCRRMAVVPVDDEMLQSSWQVQQYPYSLPQSEGIVKGHRVAQSFLLCDVPAMLTQQQQHSGPNAVPALSSSWTESAYAWQQRSRRRKREQDHPSDPVSAAWSFFRASSSSSGGGGGTGISFVDVALRVGPPMQELDGRYFQQRLPVIDIRGDAGCGKTWTIITLAARFVAATVASQFNATDHGEHLHPPVPPRVIVLDSQYDVTATKLAYAVRSALLRKMGDRLDEDRLRVDTESCCSRIHVTTASRATDWVAVLDILRNELAPNPTSPSLDQASPTLVLWDGYLDEPTTEAQRTEVIRQLVRVLHDCPVMFVSTASPSARRYEWEKHITHRIRLQRDQATSDLSSERFAATVRGNRVPYSISLAGILS